MRKWIVLLAGLAVLVLANLTIYQREKLLADGRIVLLALAPVDPRSMMQGDYMALDLQVARKVAEQPRGERDGHVVVTLDQHGVGSFARLDDGSPLGPNEILVRYRVRERRPRIATNAYFFQEGTAERYQTARYGEFRVAKDGEAILTGLRDAAYHHLGTAGAVPDSR
jgi:uncharacterized membrane-anchored protein